MTGQPLRGEVWWTEALEIGRRPVVVLSRDVVIQRLRRVVVAPCSTRIRDLDSEVVLEPGEDPVPQLCAAHLDSVDNLPLGVFIERLGLLTDDRMREVCEALAVAVECET